MLLQAESSVRHPYATVNPWLFTPAIAPHIAAAEAGLAIDTARIVAAHAQLRADADVVLAEGAGGFLVPLDAESFLRGTAGPARHGSPAGRRTQARLPQSRAADGGSDRGARSRARRLDRQRQSLRSFRGAKRTSRHSPQSSARPASASCPGCLCLPSATPRRRFRMPCASSASHWNKRKNRVAAVGAVPYDARAVSPRIKGRPRELRCQSPSGNRSGQSLPASSRRSRFPRTRTGAC